MDFNVNLTVREKLELETLRRATNGALAQVIFLILMIILIPEYPLVWPYRIVCLILIAIFIVRWTVFQKYKENPVQLLKTNPWNLYAGVVTAFFWALTIAMAISWFHLYSVVGLGHVIIMTGLLASVMYSLTPTPNVQRAYILTLGVIVCSTIFFLEQGNYRYLSLMVLIFVGYLLNASRNHSHDLKSAYEFEERLLEDNVRLQEIFNSIPGFAVLTTQSGEWLQNSRSTEKLCNPEEINKEIKSFIGSGLQRKTSELELKSSTKEKHFIVSFEKMSQGTYLTIGLPIDELKRIEKALELQKAQAEYSSRLAAVGEMAGGVSHEINNPLSVISLSAEFLENKLESENINPDIWKRHISKILETSKQISRIIKSLQNLTREEIRPVSQTVQLNEVIDEALDLSREKMKRKGIVITYKSADDFSVRGSHVDLGQVLLNLINNSYEAIPGQGHISIEVKDAGNEVFVLVSDNGTGIRKEIKEKLFLPFFSTRPVGQGSGLGLTISRAILQKYGGDLDLLNDHDPTLFRVKLQKEVKQG